MKRFVWVVMFVLVSLWVGSAAAQQKYPNGPIRLIVPWTAGGMINVTLEVMKPLLMQELGVPVVLENRPGGGGAVGWKELQVSKADGYTIGVASSSIFGAAHMTKGGVDYNKFAPIVNLTQDYFAITVNSDSRWKTLPEFYEYVKANPRKVRVGNSGNGGIWHISALVFNKETKSEMLLVPYTGGAAAVTALMGNHIEAVSVTPGDMTATLPTGKLRILALGSPNRSPFYPEVPTIKEAIGINVVAGKWTGIVAPKGMPEDRIKVLENAFEKVIQHPNCVEFMQKNRLTPNFEGTAEFTKSYAADATMMMKLLQSLKTR